MLNDNSSSLSKPSSDVWLCLWIPFFTWWPNSRSTDKDLLLGIVHSHCQRWARYFFKEPAIPVLDTLLKVPSVPVLDT